MHYQEPKARGRARFSRLPSKRLSRERTVGEGRVRAEPARGAMRGAGVVQGAAGGRIAEEKYPVLLAETRGKLETTSMPRPYGAEFHSA